MPRYMLLLYRTSRARRSARTSIRAAAVDRVQREPARCRAPPQRRSPAPARMQPRRSVYATMRPRSLDGPFAVTKEYLVGYFLLDCADLDEALKHAARCLWPATDRSRCARSWTDARPVSPSGEPAASS